MHCSIAIGPFRAGEVLVYAKNKIWSRQDGNSFQPLPWENLLKDGTLHWIDKGADFVASTQGASAIAILDGLKTANQIGYTVNVFFEVNKEQKILYYDTIIQVIMESNGWEVRGATAGEVLEQMEFLYTVIRDDEEYFLGYYQTLMNCPWGSTNQLGNITMPSDDPQYKFKPNYISDLYSLIIQDNFDKNGYVDIRYNQYDFDPKNVNDRLTKYVKPIAEMIGVEEYKGVPLPIPNKEK